MTTTHCFNTAMLDCCPKPVTNIVRAYHFVPACYGLDDLRRRRLKIARLDELNDPFELWAIAQSDRRLRRALKSTKNEVSRRYGMLCFGLSWHNPLLWSHYAERHHGLALGFDVDGQILKEVSYVEKRPILKAINFEVANWLLFTKYVDWQYEREARIFTSLDEQDEDSGLYSANFNDQLVLREVIVGALSNITQSELKEVLGKAQECVTFTKARSAFNSFTVVNNKQGFGKE